MPAALAPKQRLGPYEIVSLLGAGGMGEVYRARDTRLGRDVALKTLPAELGDDPSRRERFEHEARTVAALNHPNIVGVFDIGSENGLLYMVTELVEGEPLHGGYPMKKISDIAAQIADGLSAAHAAQVTHRDLKPDNVMLTKDGRVKILDFGLARHAPIAALPDDATRKAISEPGVVMGTVGYMSPEQVRGMAAGPQSDIFSFGAVLYQLFCGKRAFERDTSVETMTAILKEDPPELPDSIPAGLRLIVARCLEKEPSNRIQSAKDLAFALRDLSGLTSTPSGAAPALGKPRSRRWPIATASLVGAVLGIAICLQLVDTSDPARDPVRITPFATDAGSEAGASFSPDGRSVAYLRRTGWKTEILVWSSGSDNPVKLTESENLGAPVWSADGTRVCYSNVGIWCVSATGGTPRLLLANRNTGAFRFTPDGKSMLFLRREKSATHIFESTPPGAEPKIAAGIAIPEAESLALGSISRDGTKILLHEARGQRRRWITGYPSGGLKIAGTGRSFFPIETWVPDNRHLLEVDGTGDQGSWSIQISDTLSDAKRLLFRGVDPIIRADISPDGRKVVFSTGKVEWDIHEYSMEGKRLRPVAATPAGETYPSWNRTGDMFAYLTRGSVHIARADGSEARIAARTARFGLPRFSPSGKQLAYVGDSGIEAVSVGGGISVTVAKGEASSFCWSPDGEWIWFSDSASGGLKKVPSQGGPAISLKTEGFLFDCAPDGRIAVAVDRKIQLLAADGKTERRLEIPVTQLRTVQFSPDSRLLYGFSGSRLEEWDIASASKVRSVEFEMPSYDWVFDFRVHPDGKRVLLTTGGQRYDLFMLEGFARPVTGWKRLFRRWE